MGSKEWLLSGRVNSALPLKIRTRLSADNKDHIPIPNRNSPKKANKSNRDMDMDMDMDNNNLPRDKSAWTRARGIGSPFCQEVLSLLPESHQPP